MSKKPVSRAAAVTAAALLTCAFLSKTVYTATLPEVTVIKAKEGEITHVSYAKGAFGYADLPEVKALANWKTAEVFASDGDFCEEGQPLLRVEIENYGVTKAELALAVLQAESRLAAIKSAQAETFDDYAYKTAISDAREALGKREAELENVGQSALAVSLARKVYDAERDALQKKANLENADAALLKAETERAEPFDAYTYEKSIAEAEITAERRLAELKNARDELTLAEGKVYADFDEYAYQREINAANVNYNRKRTAYDEAAGAYRKIVSSIDANTDTDIDTDGGGRGALAAEAAAAAEAALFDAEFALKSAFETYERAKAAYAEKISDEKTALVKAAKIKKEAAEIALADARRACEGLKADMARAEENFRKTYAEAKKAELASLRAAKEAALSAASLARIELARAAEDLSASLDAETKAAAEAAAQSEKNLLRAQNDLARAKAAFAKTKAASSERGAEAEAEEALLIARMKLENFEKSLPEGGLLLAPASGFVYGLSARAGDTAPLGSVIASVIPKERPPLLKFRMTAEKAADYGVGAVGDFETQGCTEGANGGKTISAVTGTFSVLEIKNLGNGEVELTAGMLSATGEPILGAAVSVRLVKTSGRQSAVIPASCLVPQSDGLYAIFTVAEQDSLFGKENFVHEVPVAVLDNNGISASVSAEIYWAFTDIVSHATKPLNDREIVAVSP